MKRAVSPAQKDILLLLGWAGLLLACSFWHPSLLAHDEGTYAAESRFMLNQGNWLARDWWGEPTYSHGIFLNWLIMLGYLLFGQRDWVARLPSVLACLVSVVLTYDIAKTLIASQPWPSSGPSSGAYARHARRLGLLSGLLLMVFSLWAQFGHLVSQNTLLVAAELLGIWALLRAERQGRNRPGWGFLAGVTFGLGFLIKTFMIVLPAIALLPYLVLQNRRHGHLVNPGLWVGILTGVGAVLLWLGLGSAEYGSDVVMGSMFGKLNELGSESYNPDGSPVYYLWNIPVNMMPWCLFAVIGSVLMLRAPGFWSSLRPFGYGLQLTVRPGLEESAPVRRHWPHAWLLLYPFLLAGLLTLFPTKTAYYPLQLHPFMAMFCAIALHHIATQPLRWPRRLLSYSFALLGMLLVALSLLVSFFSGSLFSESFVSEIMPYIPLALVLGIGWMCLPFLMSRPQKWIATWLIPAWLALGVVGLTGIYGDYSPELKAGLADEPLRSVLSDNTVDVVFTDGSNHDLHKSFTLLSFYTPQVGRLNPAMEEVPDGAHIWVAQQDADLAYIGDRPYETVATLQGWQLIKLTSR
ncbi:MAG: glycosyltransferase family 39 protein [Cyanobacteria bacterium P01_F01_bin.53]